MGILEHLITSFIASVGFGIIFNVPKKSLFKCGIVGMIGWFIYILLVYARFDSVFATFFAAFVVAVISQVFARIEKTPVTIFSVCGIIPLVPGGLAYDAMRQFVINDYDLAIELAAKAFMISGAIAIGIVFSEVVDQVIRANKRN